MQYNKLIVKPLQTLFDKLVRGGHDSFIFHARPNGLRELSLSTEWVFQASIILLSSSSAICKPLPCLKPCLNPLRYASLSSWARKDLSLLSSSTTTSIHP